MRKQVSIDIRANKELVAFPKVVQNKFFALFEILEEVGTLEEPFAKKLHHTKGLFEVRVKYKGQYRAIYAYVFEDIILVLHAFHKKTQKTPLKEIQTAVKRLNTLMKGRAHAK